MVMMAPVKAVQKLFAKTGWSMESVDLFELNEAFSVQAIAVVEQLGLPRKSKRQRWRSRPWPPIGASGAGFSSL
jgi:acetyl-CoA C-acetyltransferase